MYRSLLLEKQVVKMGEGERKGGEGGWSTDHMHETLNNVFMDIEFGHDHLDKSSMNDSASSFYGYMKDANH